MPALSCSVLSSFVSFHTCDCLSVLPQSVILLLLPSFLFVSQSVCLFVPFLETFRYLFIVFVSVHQLISPFVPYSLTLTSDGVSRFACLSLCLSVCVPVCPSLYLSLFLSIVLSHSPRTNWRTAQTIHLSTILVPKNAQTAAPPTKKPVGIISCNATNAETKWQPGESNWKTPSHASVIKGVECFMSRRGWGFRNN